MDRKSLVIAGLVLVGLGGAGVAQARAGSDGWTADPYNQKGLTINTRSIELKKGKIWFKLQFVNNTDKAMAVDPDSIQARLPDGRSVTRLKGVFDKFSATHNATIVKPYAGADVNIEYDVGEPRRVTLVLNGISIDGKPQKFPDFVARGADGDWAAAPYEHERVKVVVESAQVKGETLSLKLSLINSSDIALYVDANAFAAKLPDGSLVQRAKSLFGGGKPKLIQPHAAGDVSLDFKVGNAPKVALQMGGVNAGALNLPELVLEPK